MQIISNINKAKKREIAVNNEKMGIKARKKRNKEAKFTCVKYKLNGILRSENDREGIFKKYLSESVEKMTTISFLSYHFLNYFLTKVIEERKALSPEDRGRIKPPEIDRTFLNRIIGTISCLDKNYSTHPDRPSVDVASMVDGAAAAAAAAADGGAGGASTAPAAKKRKTTGNKRSRVSNNSNTGGSSESARFSAISGSSSSSAAANSANSAAASFFYDEQGDRNQESQRYQYFQHNRAVALNSSSYGPYIRALQEQGLSVFEVAGDGNCLFRSVAHQVYGDDSLHDLVRQECMDYMEANAGVFSQFVEGGAVQFGEYLREKRKLFVWGDDPEIQAMCA